MPRYLTKSRFKLALECPTKLYYHDRPERYPNRKREDEFLLALAEGGFQVGELAKCLHPGGVEVRSLNHAQALAETRELLARDEVVIFEAAIAFESFFIRIDVLKKTGDELQLIEVKAKSFDSTEGGDPFRTKKGFINTEWLPYLQDVAFQTWVLEQAYPGTFIRPFLMLADKGRRTSIDGLNQRFRISRDGERRGRVRLVGDTSLGGLGEPVLTSVEVRDHVDQILQDRAQDPDKLRGEDLRGFLERAHVYAELYGQDHRFSPSIGRHCKSCEFHSAGEVAGEPDGFQECWMEALGWTREMFNRPHVFDLWNFRKAEILETGPFLLEQLDPEAVFMKRLRDDGLVYDGANAARQHLQLRIALEADDAEWIDPALFDEMATWTWPLHFIDFETSIVALPFTRWRRPYEQTAFQFSCHTLHRDGRLEHQEWIEGAAGVFPNFEFVRRLKTVLEGDDGTIFRYAAHENTILRAIHAQLELDRDTVPDAVALMAWIDEVTQFESETLDGKSVKDQGGRNMVDLCELVRRHYYQRRMKGSNSIKKVLPAVLSVSEALREKYSRPYEGTNHHGQIWWQRDQASGEVMDPYKLLSPLIDDADLSEDRSLVLENGEEIDDGGAALVAYGKLQFEDLPGEERARLVSSLLRYCELDTLAMVMIVEHLLQSR